MEVRESATVQYQLSLVVTASHYIITYCTQGWGLCVCVCVRGKREGGREGDRETDGIFECNFAVVTYSCFSFILQRNLN